MALETYSYINSFVVTNPTANDPKSQGDDHIRGIKYSLSITFPNITGAVTMTHTELNSVTARGLIAGQTWTGTHTFPATTYGVTAAAGASGTQFATLDFVNSAIISPQIPGLTGNEYKFLTTTNGTSSSFTNLLKSTVIRVADGTDLTKLAAFDLSALATGTTRQIVMPNHDVALGMPYLKVSDQKASGTTGGTSSAATSNIRTLNTVDANTITGASLASNQVTLPAGTYISRGRAPSSGGTGVQRAFLYNVTDAANTLIGANSHGFTASSSDCVVSGRFTIAGTKAFELRHYTQSASGIGDANSQAAEVYSELEFIKVI